MSAGGTADIAVLKAILDPSGIKQGAQDGSKALEQLEKSADQLDGVMDAVTKTGKKLLGVLGIYKFAEWIKGAVDLAARYTTLGVVLTQVGKSAGYSSGQITTLTKVLEKQGISMLQARQTVISMIQAKLDLAKADELAAVAQDAAVTAGLNSSETLQRIVFGITSSQQEVLRTVGITVQFDEAYRNLSRTLNKSISDLTNTEKAQARVNAVIEAAKPIAGAYGASMETAGKQVKSMERYVEDLQVKIGQAFQPAYTALIFSLANAVKFLGENATVLLAVIGAVAGRGLAAFVGAMNAARLAIVAKAKAAIGLQESYNGMAMAEGRVAEASFVSAKAAKAATAATLADLNVTKAAIVQQRALAVARLQTANATMRAAIGSPNKSIEQAVTDAGTFVAADRTRASATADLAAYGRQQADVEGKIKKTSAAMVTLEKTTSLSTRAFSAMGGVVNMLGGTLGIALIAIGAFYTAYSAEMQKAKDQVDTNAEAIKKKLKELEDSQNRSALGRGVSFDDRANVKYEKQIRDMTKEVDDARRRILDYSVSISESFKGIFAGGGGQFVAELNTLFVSFKKGDLGAADFLYALDKLEARFPGMASSVAKAKDQVALYAVKQDELNKFLKENEGPLTKAIANLDAFARGFRGLNAEVKPPEFYTPNLGDQGTALKREIDNQLALQRVIRTGSKEQVRALQDEQAATEKANALIAERVRGNEKLQAASGKTLQQLWAMGPVADREIAQLQIDAKAVYDLEKRKSSLTRTTEKLQSAEEKAYSLAKERKQFLDGFQNTDTAQQQLEEKLAEYARSRRLAGASQSSINNDIAEARIRDARVRLKEATDRLYESETKRQEAQAEEIRLQRMGTDAYTLQIDAMKKANGQTLAQIQALQVSKKAYEDLVLQQRIDNAVRTEELRLLEKGLTMSEAKKLDLAEQIRLETYRTRVVSAYLDLVNSPNFNKDKIADASVVFGTAAKSTSSWAEALQQLNSGLTMMGQSLEGSSQKAVQAISVVTTGMQVMMALQKQIDAKKNRKEGDLAMPGGIVGTGLSYAAVGAASFGAGYSAGGTTTNKLAGAGKGLLAGVGSGAATGASIASFGGPIGAGVGAIIGGVVGLVGGILGSAKAGKQAAAQAIQAQKQIQQSMNALAMTFSNDQLGAAIQNAMSQFNDMRKGIEAAYSGKKYEAERNRLLADVNKLEIQRLEILRKEFALGQERIQQDNRVLLLQAQGKEFEAAAMEFVLRQERELADARTAGYTETTLAAIAERQRAQAAKFAADQARAEAAKMEEKRRTQFDYVNQINSYSDPRGAAQSAFEEAQRRRITDAIANEATAVELATIELFNLAEAAERNRQIAEQDRRTGESLTGRILGSMSDKRASEDFNRSVANRQELADAAGQPAYITDLIKYAQFAEASVVQMQRAIEDQTKVIRDKATAQISALTELNEAVQKDAAKQIEIIDAGIKAQQDAYAAIEKSTGEAIAKIQAATETQIAQFDRMLESQQVMLEYASRNLQVAEEQLQTTRQAYEALYGFSQSFNASDLSSLNALDKRADLARQLEEAFSKGRTDASAAASVPAIAQALLQSSRNVFSIGDGYKADEARVKEITAALLGQYGGQLGQNIAARDSAAAMVESAQSQIENIQSMRQSVIDSANEQIKVQEKIREAAKLTADTAVEALNLDKDRITKSASDYATETQKQITAIETAAQKQIDEVIRIETLNNDMRIKTSSFYAAMLKFIENGFPTFAAVPFNPVSSTAAASAPPTQYERESMTFMTDSRDAMKEELELLRGVLTVARADTPAVVGGLSSIEASIRELVASQNRSARRQRAENG